MKTNKNKSSLRIFFWILLLAFTLASCAAIFLLYRSIQKAANPATAVNETATANGENNQPLVPQPAIDQQFLTINEYSRPGRKTDSIEYIVIHYLGNPETTAQENRDYFESLKDLKNVYMSANYIVGLDGEIIQCVPDGEIAYASNEQNHNSISVENCHLDDTGRFLRDTYLSTVKLTAYLTELYQLDRDRIIRHYDVTGKECPLFYVENEDLWEQFKDDVMSYRQLCDAGKIPSDEELLELLEGIGQTYRDKSEKIETKNEKDDSDGGSRKRGSSDKGSDYRSDSDYVDDNTHYDNDVYYDDDIYYDGNTSHDENTYYDDSTYYDDTVFYDDYEYPSYGNSSDYNDYTPPAIDSQVPDTEPYVPQTPSTDAAVQPDIPVTDSQAAAL